MRVLFQRSLFFLFWHFWNLKMCFQKCINLINLLAYIYCKEITRVHIIRILRLKLCSSIEWEKCKGNTELCWTIHIHVLFDSSGISHFHPPPSLIINWKSLHVNLSAKESCCLSNSWLNAILIKEFISHGEVLTTLAVYTKT